MGKQRKKKQSKDPDSTAKNPDPSSSASRDVILPQAFPSHLLVPDNDFLLNEPPYRDSFSKALETAYEGFVIDRKIDSMAESKVQASLATLHQHEYFRHDITQPFGLGTKCAKTYVTRCLVGEPGTTYKYLGLRMFSHPWNTPGTPDTMSTSGALQNVGDLGKVLSSRTSHHLEELARIRRRRRASSSPQGRSAFDICLINRMEATDDRKGEPSMSHKGTKTSVSWHADSSLEHYSTIAVYQTLVPTKSNGIKNNKTSKPSEIPANDWYVALRVAHHAEGPQASHRGSNIESTLVKGSPPIAVSLPSGSAYYLLDDFNHHHQHTVLTIPSSVSHPKQSSDFIRYSSTYRLLRDSHNVEYILRRCQSVISDFHKKGPKVWRSEQLLLNEIESEWICQFYIQGSQHYQLLAGKSKYWKEPMQQLLLYWSRLEQRTKQVIDLLQNAAIARCTMNKTNNAAQLSKKEKKSRERQRKALTTVKELMDRNDSSGRDALVTLYAPFAELLESRAKLRDLWKQRQDDPVFHTLPRQNRPLPFPFTFNDHSTASNNPTVGVSPLPGTSDALHALAASLRRCGQAFESSNPNHLPKDDTSPSKSSNEDRKNSNHSKALDWEGWEQKGTDGQPPTFALELQEPWAGAVLDGTKKIETRAYNLPPALLGQKVWILESPTGKAGVSAMANVVDLHKSNAKLIGWCRFSKVLSYTAQEEFERDSKLHLVSPQSGYGWKPGKTQTIYGWVVQEAERIDCHVYNTAVRRMRSLFQLKEPNKPSSSGKKRKKGQKSGKEDSKQRKRKKRF